MSNIIKDAVAKQLRMTIIMLVLEGKIQFEGKNQTEKEEMEKWCKDHHDKKTLDTIYQSLFPEPKHTKRIFNWIKK